MIPTKRLESRMNSSRFNSFLLPTFYCLSIQFFHFLTEATEDDLLDFLRREVPNRLHGNLGGGLPGVAINSTRNSGEGDRLESVLLGQIEAAFVAGFQKCRFAMLAIPINWPRSMDDELCREPEAGG